MSQIEKMLENVLKSIVPAETLALLTKENLDKVKEGATNFVNGINGKLDAISQEQAELRRLIEAMQNDNGNSRARTKRNSPAIGNDAGNN